MSRERERLYEITVVNIEVDPHGCSMTDSHTRLRTFVCGANRAASSAASRDTVNRCAKN